MKTSALNLWAHTRMITNHISKLMDDKNEVRILELWDYFPDLFEKEKEIHDKSRELEEFEAFKNKRRNHAEQVKAYRGRKRGDS